MASSGRTYRGVDVASRRAHRRAALLDAALEEFTTTGYRASRIADICTRARVSTRTFYEEFEGKQDVLLVLHDRVNDLALSHVRHALGTVLETDAVTRIGTLLDAFVAAVTADPRLPRLAYVEAVGVSPALEAQHQRWVTRWAEFIAAEAARAAEHGLAPRRDYRLTGIALVGAVTGLLRAWQAGNPPEPVAVIADEIKSLMSAAITRQA
ncbi:TetR family transcriptional regulator [Prauserella shujinwangii]|uniref:TetR family transcriptional regulator n=1 Tax=Prauserella shujinwangii TaxID=1453103 RepID=A0A2T0M0S2_9PSEU|nr:TetR/AcrR family transcriptional regulator [Prauserella shujinwangii]PRX50206.1 TetR family transcriptional regulator [Prauserella shujinwangii]